MIKQSFLKGTLILLIAGIINRCLGFIPRITLPRWIGIEGVGIYQLGWPFLLMLITLISGGIPVAVAKCIAEAEAANESFRIPYILKVSIILALLMSCFGIVICICGSSWIAHHLLTDARASTPITMMSSMLIFIAISSVFRGYFQGKLNMIPTACSQLVETMVRIIMVLICAVALLPQGVEYAAGGAMLGVAIGECAGMLCLIFLYLKISVNKKTKTFVHSFHSRSGAYIREFKKICFISIPVTGSKLIGSTSYMLESIVIAQSLAVAGIATAIATAQYGALQGMIIPILLLPSALTSSLSISLVPSLSEAAARQDHELIRYRLFQSLHLSIVTGVPFSIMMLICAEPICFFLYHSIEIALMLKLMAPLAIFIYFQAPLQAALQALNQSHIALINTLISSIVKLLLIFCIASQPEWGIYGAIIGINVSIVLTCFLNGYQVFRLFHFQINWCYVWKWLICIALTSYFTYASFHLITLQVKWIQLCLTILISVCVYVGMLFLLQFMPPGIFSKIKKWWGNARPS